MTTKIEAHSISDLRNQVKNLPKWDPEAPNKDCQLYRVRTGADLYSPKCYGKKCKDGSECPRDPVLSFDKDKDGKDFLIVECCPKVVEEPKKDPKTTPQKGK